MNKISARIFKHYKPNNLKLLKYGFSHSDGAYFYGTVIMDGQFELKIRITTSEIETQVIDLSINEPYSLFLADGASGNFVGAVRAAYENVLTDIAEKCFDKYVFKTEYAQKLIKYVADTYGDALEFLWEKFSDNAIWRRKDNKKWYGLLLTVAKNKIGLPTDEKTEIIDLRATTEDIETIVDGRTVFGGYHMNKKHWITICLDGSVPLQKIKKMLDKSYELARK